MSSAGHGARTPRGSRAALPALSLLAWLVPTSAVAKPITLDASADSYSVADHVEVLVDPGATLGIEDVASRTFQSAEEVGSGVGIWPGQRAPAVWLRFVVVVPTRGVSDEWDLVVGHPRDPATVYVEQQPGRFQASALTLDANGASSRVALPREPGAHRVFLRAHWPLIRPSILHVATHTGSEHLLQRLLGAQGLYLGVMLAMLLVNLLMGGLLRDRVHLWYVAFVATSVLFFSSSMGTLSRFVLPTVAAGTLFRPQAACLTLTVLTGIQFSRSFLDTRRTARRSDFVLRLYLALAAVVLVGVLVLPDELALSAVAMLGMLVPFVALLAGFAAWRAGSRWARFYLAGWSVFTLSGFLFAFGVNAVDSISIFQLSSTVEAAFFAVALVDRMRILGNERERAEHALARSERRFQSIFDGTIEATWLLDSDDKLLEVNDTARRAWKTEREPSRGRTLAALQPWAGSKRAAALLSDAITRAKTAGQARFEASFGTQPATRWYDVSAKTMSDGMMLIEARDVTELKHAELEVARSEKLAALGQLVAGVAHEVNNPNNFLTFNLPVLQEYLDALRPHVEAAGHKGDVSLYGMGIDEFFADATALIGNMKHGTERIAGIVSQLRSYVRHNDEAQWEEADVNRVVENASTLVRTQLRQLVTRFDSDLAQDLPRVRMSPGPIEQVVMNLLLNAGQAAAKTQDSCVEVRTRREGTHVVITVQDNGPGVPAELAERIFEPFFTTKSREQGTGMGLAISQRIVDEHGGSLELAHVERGACFVVRLPIQQEAP